MEHRAVTSPVSDSLANPCPTILVQTQVIPMERAPPSASCIGPNSALDVLTARIARVTSASPLVWRGFRHRLPAGSVRDKVASVLIVWCRRPLPALDQNS